VTDDDLTFILSLQPDTTAVDKALADVASQVSDAGKGALKDVVPTGGGGGAGGVGGKPPAVLTAAEKKSLTDQFGGMADEIIEIMHRQGGLAGPTPAIPLGGGSQTGPGTPALGPTPAGIDPESQRAVYDLLEETYALRKDDYELAQEQAALKVTDDAGTIKSRVDAEKEITRQRHEQQILALKAGLDPEAIKERVRREREISELRRATGKAEDKERREQERPGFFQKAGEDPGKAISGLMAGLGSVFKEVKEEFGKGGIGGVIDSLFAGKGGKGNDDTGGLLANIVGGIGGGGSLGRIGAMAGEKAGGAQGAEAGRELAEMVPKVIGAPAELVAGALSDLGGALSSLGGTLGPIGAGFDLISNVMGKVGSAVKAIPVVGEVLGPFVDALTAIPGILKGVTETLTSLAAKASPAAFELFGMAVDDVQAAVGQAFVPVLYLMRDAVRLVGDVLANILPNMDEVSGALGGFREAFAELGNEIRELMTEIGPLIRENLIFMLQEVGFVLTVVVKIIGQWVSVLTFLLRPLKSLLELMGVDTRMRSGVGAAARPAQFAGLEEYQKQLQLSAYREPGAVPAEDKVPNILEQILTWLQENITVEKFGKAVGDAIKAAPGKLGEKAGEVVKDGIRDYKDFSRKLGERILHPFG
jgi:hypothetical protein